MAIVKMTKIKLIGLSYQKEQILNTLHKTGCVELIATEDIAETFCVAENDNLEQYQKVYDRAKKSIDFFSENISLAKDKPYYPAKYEQYLKNFFVSYDEFMSAEQNGTEVNAVMEKTERLSAELNLLKSDIIKKRNLYHQLEVYSSVNENLSDFKDTKFTRVFFGTVKQEALSSLKSLIKDYPLTELKVYSERTQSVVLIASFYTEADEVGAKLNELGFAKCIFDFDCTAKDKINALKNEIKSDEEKINKISETVCKTADKLKNLKIYADYYRFCLEKEEKSRSFRCTGKTFVLEGYLPFDKEEVVKNALSSFDALFFEFSEPTKNDTPPTLTRNGKLVHQTEFITDMYSAPDYREMDPNKVVFFFFMLFMGVIMADMGYGILMICLGAILARRIPVDNGAKKLWKIISISGFFTILFGFLFNSLFGFAVLPFNILPSPVPQGGNTVGLMTILLGCLGLGVLQIAVGYFCKALNCFKNGKILDGVLDGIVWVLFFVGFVFAAFNFLVSYLMPKAIIAPWLHDFFETVKLPGLILVAVSLLCEVLLSGRHEKGFGKFAKGFGALYGLISIFSDILSYARLFGLMLSGMIIASTFNDLGIQMFSSGVLGYVLGGLIIVVGHIFNIAMGVLGAYIHDSRLQYIEFFGKFYKGEGEPFAPLGSSTEFIYLTK